MDYTDFLKTKRIEVAPSGFLKMAESLNPKLFDFHRADCLVYSPFTGIGSEGYVAIGRGRRFEGDELKVSYWKQACANLKNAENLMEQDSLFSEVAV